MSRSSMRHLPIDAKRFEDAKAASLSHGATAKAPSLRRSYSERDRIWRGNSYNAQFSSDASHSDHKENNEFSISRGTHHSTEAPLPQSRRKDIVDQSEAYGAASTEFSAAVNYVLRLHILPHKPIKSRSDGSPGSYYTAESNQHSQDEFDSASGSKSKSSASGAISSSSPNQDCNESRTGNITIREETYSTNRRNRACINIQALITRAHLRNMGGIR
jgi:hypothetical protein